MIKKILGTAVGEGVLQNEISPAGCCDLVLNQAHRHHQEEKELFFGKAEEDCNVLAFEDGDDPHAF